MNNEEFYLNVASIASILLAAYILGLPNTTGKYNIIGVFLISVLKGLKTMLKMAIKSISFFIETFLDLIIMLLELIFGR